MSRKKFTVCYVYITKDHNNLALHPFSFSSYVLAKETSMAGIATEYTKNSEQLPFSVLEHTLEYLEENHGQVINIIPEKIEKADEGVEHCIEKYKVILKK